MFTLEQNTRIELNKDGRIRADSAERGERFSNIFCWRIVNTKTKRDGIVNNFTFVEQIVHYWPANPVRRERRRIPDELMFAPLIHTRI